MGGSGTAGKATGGTAPGGAGAGGSGGKANGGSGGSSAGSSGSAAGGTTGAAGGVPSGGAGGDDGAAGEAMGGDNAGGAGGAGGAPPDEPQLSDQYWLNKFCDSLASETLGCEKSGTWSECFNSFTDFVQQGEFGGVCSNEIDVETFPLTSAMYNQLDATATACGKTSAADWSCDLTGAPIPKDQDCAAAYEDLKAAYTSCGGPQ